MRSFFKKPSVIYWMLTVFSSVLIIILGAVSGYQSYQSTVRQQNYFIHQAQETIDNYLFHLQKSMQSMVNDPQVQDPRVLPLQASDYYNFYLQIQNLDEKNISENIYIAYQNSGTILSHRASFPFSSFFNSQFSNSQISEENFQKFLFSPVSASRYYMNIPGESENSGKILLKQPLKFHGDKPFITAFSIVEDQEILYMLARFSGNSQNALRLLDEAGNTLAIQEGGSQKRNWISFPVHSQIGEWVYEISISKHDFYHHIWLSMEIVLVLILIGLVIHLFGAGYVFRSNRKNILHIADLSQKAAFELEQQTPFLRQDFFRKLFTHEFQNRDQILQAARKAKIQIDRKYFQVFLLEPISAPNTNILRDLQAALQPFPEILWTDLSKDNLVFILCGANEETLLKEASQALCQNLQDYFSSSCGPYLIGISEICRQISSVPESYGQAWCALMNFTEEKPTAVCRYADMVPSIQPFRMPVQTKTKLIQCISLGKVQEVHNLLREIIQNNFVRQNLNEDGLRLLWLEFYEILLRVQETVPIENPSLQKEIQDFCNNFYRAYHPLRMRDVRNLFQNIAAGAADMQTESSEDLIHQVQEYVNSHYRDPDISLQMLADRFQISETYVSHLFKKIFHVNFFEYLENLRLQEACRLLQMSKLPISEIAHATGYCCTNTFGKAFKRKYQVSASQFRNQCTVQKAEAPKA